MSEEDEQRLKHEEQLEEEQQQQQQLQQKLATHGSKKKLAGFSPSHSPCSLAVSAPNHNSPVFRCPHLEQKEPRRHQEPSCPAQIVL